MDKSVIFIGPKSSGKSTLIQKILTKSSEKYKTKQQIVDYLPDEIKSGCTVETKRFRINLNDPEASDNKELIIIDTPGTFKYRKWVIKELSQADYAFIVVDFTGPVLVETAKEVKFWLLAAFGMNVPNIAFVKSKTPQWRTTPVLTGNEKLWHKELERIMRSNGVSTGTVTYGGITLIDHVKIVDHDEIFSIEKGKYQTFSEKGYIQRKLIRSPPTPLTDKEIEAFEKREINTQPDPKAIRTFFDTNRLKNAPKFTMSVQRVFSVPDAGLIVAGRVLTGQISVGDNYYYAGGFITNSDSFLKHRFCGAYKTNDTVKSIRYYPYDSKNTELKTAIAGQHVGLCLGQGDSYTKTNFNTPRPKPP